jgi:hypothetical protein
LCPEKTPKKKVGLLTNKTKVAVNPAIPNEEIVSKTIVITNVKGCILNEKRKHSFNIKKNDT